MTDDDLTDAASHIFERTHEVRLGFHDLTMIRGLLTDRVLAEVDLIAESVAPLRSPAGIRRAGSAEPTTVAEACDFYDVVDDLGRAVFALGTVAATEASLWRQVEDLRKEEAGSTPEEASR